MAVFVLKPLRAKHFVKSRLDFPQSAANTGHQAT
jgi:hypothetical protein